MVSGLVRSASRVLATQRCGVTCQTASQCYVKARVDKNPIVPVVREFGSLEKASIDDENCISRCQDWWFVNELIRRQIDDSCSKAPISIRS